MISFSQYLSHLSCNMKCIGLAMSLISYHIRIEDRCTLEHMLNLLQFVRRTLSLIGIELISRKAKYEVRDAQSNKFPGSHTLCLRNE